MSAIPYYAGGEVIELPITRQTTEFQLSKEQEAAIDAIIQAAEYGGRFLFVTGKAGTGKSTILRKVRNQVPCSVVMAPTGLAALNVGGSTIHRFFGFGTSTGKKQSDGTYEWSKDNVRAATGNKADLIRRLDLIIIDEISMVRADLLDRMSWTLQKTLQNDLPFGGITVVAFGDMWQLEPVVGDKQADFIAQHYPKSPFWFDSKSVSPETTGLFETEAIKIEIHSLEEVFRQKGDNRFIDALNLVRVGDPAGLAYINTRAGIDAPKGVVKICFTNAQGQEVNDTELAHIAGDAVTYTAEIEGEIAEKDYPAPFELELKVGARVMVTKNIEGSDGRSLVNGDLGEVVDLEHGPMIWLDNGGLVKLDRAEWKEKDYVLDVESGKPVERVVATYRQYPLKLAWAITAHKSQGQTYDTAALTLERRAFAHGQLYVALSRVRSMDGLYLRRKLTADDLCVNRRVKELFGTKRTVTLGGLG